MVQVINNPSVPFVCPIKGGLDPGSMIRIQGAVPEGADKFNVNLHCGRPPSDLALHISVRFLQCYIARNSLHDEDWGEEEGDGKLTISPGQSFEILILCDPSSYKIAVNGQHFCEFRHRIPFNGVSHLEIDGRVELQIIAVETASLAPPPPPPRQPPSNADFSSGYDLPPPPGHYGQAPPPQGPYGGGPGYYPHRPPGQQEESGVDSLLQNAGAAIAGAVVCGLAENFLSGLAGSGGQSHNTQQHPPMQPQQPHYQGGPQPHGQQSSIVGDLLGNLASELARGGQSRHPQQHHPTQPQQPPYQGGPLPHGQQSSIVGDLLGNLASEIIKPSRRN